MEAAHFPEEPADTGLTILDRLTKKKKNTLKVTTLTSCMNFRMMRELRRIRATCPAVYLYCDNVDKLTYKYGHGEMRNKKLINRRNDITQGWQFCSPLYRLGKGRGKKKKKVIATRGIRIWSPTQVLTSWNLLNRRNMLLSLWCSDSALNTFFLNF